MPPDDIFYRRHLPHYQPESATFFVTFRLAGSLPRETERRLREEQTRIERALAAIVDDAQRARRAKEERGRYFARFDKLLDASTQGPLWLRDERIAALLTRALHAGNGKDFELVVYCIMPNHVHMVFRCGNELPEKDSDRLRSLPATRVLKAIKGATAREANKLLARVGSFWQHESYDHVVRNAAELKRIAWYVLQNPVRAGLVARWEDWPWKYVQEQFIM